MYVSQEVWRLANPDFDQHINEGTSAQSSYYLPALSPSVCQPQPSRCCSNNPILSWQSLAGRKEMKAKQAFSSWRKKILCRNLCISLARIGSHGSPLDQSKGSEVPHLDSGPSWFFPSNWALATQTQVGFYSEGRRNSCWGGNSSQILISSPDYSLLQLHLSNCLEYLPYCPVASNSIFQGKKFLFSSNRWLLFLHFLTFSVAVSSIHPS